MRVRIRSAALAVVIAAIVATGLWLGRPGDRSGAPPVPKIDSRSLPPSADAPAEPDAAGSPGEEAGPVSLRGRIVHGDRTPFRGFFAVESAHEKPFPVAEDGGFVLRSRFAGGVRIVASTDGFRAVSGYVADPREEEFVFVVDGEGREVAGLVIDAETREPVPGARVESEGGRAELTGACTTDADGRFRCPFRGGYVTLAVDAPGYAPARLLFRPGAEISVPLLRGAVLEGRVVASPGGRPVAGIPVYACRDDGRPDDVVLSVETDRTGAFRIERLPAGEWNVFALGTGFSPKGAGALSDAWRYNPFAVRLEAGEKARHDLEVVPAGRIVGRVLDESGDPVPGTELSVSGGNMTPWERICTREAGGTSGPDGRFRLGSLMPGVSYSLRADSPRYADVHLRAVARVEPTEEVEIRFEPAGFIDVRVTDPDGRPIAGALVILDPFGRDFEIAGLGRTGPDGRLRVGPLHLYLLEMSVHATGYFQHRRDDDDAVQPGLAGEVPSLSVVLRPGLEIRGRVSLPEGAFARKLEVSATSVEDEDREVSADVDVDGEFRISPLEPGSYRLRATGVVDRREHEALVDAAAGVDGVVLRLVPSGPAPSDPTPPWIARVVGGDGAEVASGGYVTGYLDERGVWRDSNGRFTDGRVRLPGDADAVTVEVFDPRDAAGGALPFGPVRAGPFARTDGNVVLRMPAETRIEARIVRPDGVGVRSVRVEARPAERRGIDEYWPAFAREITDPEGRFSLGGLGEEEYVLRFHSPPGFVPLPSIRVAAGGDPLLIRLEPSKRAVLTVVDTAGEKVADAGIALERREIAPGGDRWVRDRVWADEGGRVVLDGLSTAAHYRLTVSGSSSKHREKVIEPWSPVDFRVVLFRKSDLVGFVRDPSGAPIHGVRVMRRTGDDWDTGATDAEGRFTFKGLEDPRAELAVVGRYLSEEEREGLAGTEVSVSGGPVLLTFDPGPYIAVRLGAGWRHRVREVVLRSLDGRETRSSTIWSEDDRALFAGLRRDVRYDLWIGPHPLGLTAGDDLYAHLEGVSPTKEDFVVRPKEGKSIRGRITIDDKRVNDWTTVRLVRGAVRLECFTRGGRFEFRGLPDGKWSIAVRKGVDGVTFQGTAEVEAGTEVDIELRVE